MSKINLTYYYTDELKQLELVDSLLSEFQQLTIQKICIESEKQIDSDIKVLPCFVFNTNTEVVKLFGEQTKIELSTLIKELL